MSPKQPNAVWKNRRLQLALVMLFAVMAVILGYSGNLFLASLFLGTSALNLALWLHEMEKKMEKLEERLRSLECPTNA